MGASPGGKDWWDKLAIVLSPLGGLLTAIAVASLGLIGSRALDRQQSSEATGPGPTGHGVPPGSGSVGRAGERPSRGLGLDGGEVDAGP